MDLISKFALGEGVLEISLYGGGHINATYLVATDGGKYILQKINRFVFKDPADVMENIVKVTEHLRGKADVLSMVPCKDGAMWHVANDGDYWRMYDFVENTVCKEITDDPDIFAESGRAFGEFIDLMADFDPKKLAETIPHFHDTPRRYNALAEAIKADPMGRVRLVRPEINFAMARRGFADVLMNLQQSGQMPIRVVHNDAKLSNVLFCAKTMRAKCVIDLDTVMPGLAVTDFGDGIRFGASTAAEDEKNPDKVEFSLPLYMAYRRGFLSGCKSLTPLEAAHLPHGAKMMTLENGIRFLTDFISGDVYYKIQRDGQNLDRCRTHFKLVRSMEEQLPEVAFV